MGSHKRPNILLLFTDQLRADAIGASGNPIVQTPAIDRLCEHGVMFNRAYTPSPVCVSARYSLITGLLPHRSGCFNNGSPMSRELPTMMGALTEAGYQTHGVGKMHFHPVRHPFGFQTLELSEEIPGKVDADDFLLHLQKHNFNHVHEPHGIRSDMYYIPQVSQLPAHLHTTAWTADRSLDFLAHREKEQPFFLWTSFIKPHPPFDPPVPWNKLYRTIDMPLPHRPSASAEFQTWWMRHQNRYKYRESGPDDNLMRTMKAAYYACVSFIDYQIGRIIDFLEQTGELDNTVIVFTADHGEFLGDYNSFGKRSFLDPAARVPLVMCSPRELASGLVCDTPTSLVDVMPTLLELGGVDTKPYRLDGLNLQDIASKPSQSRMIFGQLDQGKLGLYMAFDGRFKYTYSAADEAEYLTDIVADEGETKNLAKEDAAQEHVARLRSALFERFTHDAYTEPIENDAWKKYGIMPDRSPDQDRIFQHARWTQPFLDIPGYNKVV